MAPELIGLIGIVCLLALLTLGVPIGVTLALAGVGGLAVMISPEAAIAKAGVVIFEVSTKYELGVLPLFLLMAHLCFAAGASRDFFDVAARFVGHRRGGLGLAAIAGCAGFGSISGSSLATVATVGSAALPEMRRAGYQPGFAAGALAAGGTLGALIPPSGALIVFGIIAEQSIGKLFVAAIIPGLSQALFYMAAIAILCFFKPELGPPSARVPWRERMRGAARRRRHPAAGRLRHRRADDRLVHPNRSGVGRGDLLVPAVRVPRCVQSRGDRGGVRQDAVDHRHDLPDHLRRDPVRHLRQRDRPCRPDERRRCATFTPARSSRSSPWR